MTVQCSYHPGPVKALPDSVVSFAALFVNGVCHDPPIRGGFGGTRLSHTYLFRFLRHGASMSQPSSIIARLTFQAQGQWSFTKSYVYIHYSVSVPTHLTINMHSVHAEHCIVYCLLSHSSNQIHLKWIFFYSHHTWWGLRPDDFKHEGRVTGQVAVQNLP